MMVNENIKCCSKCGEAKPINEFRKNRNQCLSCYKSWCKAYKEKNKIIIKEVLSKYYKDNTKKLNDKSKKYYEDNKDRLNLLSSENYYNNIESHKIRSKKYYIENKTDIDYRHREYYENNIELILLGRAKQRALKKGLEFNIDLYDIKKVMCNICPLLEIPIFINKGLKYNSISLDRIDNKKGYIKNNIWVVSHKANASKNDSTIEEYKKIIDMYYYAPNFNNSSDTSLNITQILGSAKYRSKKKNIPFTINRKYLKSIIPLNEICPILNIKLRSNIGRPNYFSPSLDRIDNVKGYVLGNVRIVSLKANKIKNNLTLSEMQCLFNNWQYALNHIC